MSDEVKRPEVLMATDLDALYPKLAEAFDEGTVQRTTGKLTGRGYDTTGYGYQHVVNRLNEIIGLAHWRTVDDTTLVATSVTSSGRERYEYLCTMTVQIGNSVNGEWQVLAERSCYGGHISASHADAMKGAFTNALKKTIALFGPGRQAYEGTIDDDNQPIDDTPERGRTGKATKLTQPSDTTKQFGTQRADTPDDQPPLPPLDDLHAQYPDMATLTTPQLIAGIKASELDLHDKGNTGFVTGDELTATRRSTLSTPVLANASIWALKAYYAHLRDTLSKGDI